MSCVYEHRLPGRSGSSSLAWMAAVMAMSMMATTTAASLSVKTNEDLVEAVVSNCQNEADWDVIEQFDTKNVTNMNALFYEHCRTFNGDLSAWDTRSVTTMASMFTTVESFSSDLSKWNTAAVTDFSYMFSGAYEFNSDLSDWETALVTDINFMFAEAEAFNGNLSNWNTGAVTEMDFTFHGARSFNGDVSKWNTMAVTDMQFTFTNCPLFEGDLSNWNTSAVTNMEFLFSGATAFNSNLSSWDTGAVTTMHYMFHQASAFNSDLSKWNTSAVKDMNGMFSEAIAFDMDYTMYWDTSDITADKFKLENQPCPIGYAKTRNFGSFDNRCEWFEVADFCHSTAGGNVQNCSGHGECIVSLGYETNNQTCTCYAGYAGDMCDTFIPEEPTQLKRAVQEWCTGAHPKTHAMMDWDVSRIMDFNGIFEGIVQCSNKLDINAWDVSQATSMEGMFANSIFNEPIANWTVSEVVSMKGMFSGAKSFDQDLSLWDTARVKVFSRMFLGATSFKQNLENWRTDSAMEMSQMFTLSGISSSSNFAAWNVSAVEECVSFCDACVLPNFAGCTVVEESRDSSDATDTSIIPAASATATGLPACENEENCDGADLVAITTGTASSWLGVSLGIVLILVAGAVGGLAVWHYKKRNTSFSRTSGPVLSVDVESVPMEENPTFENEDAD